MKKILLGGWDKTELEILNNFVAKENIEDIIILTENHLNYVLKDIVEGNVSVECKKLLSEKLIIFDGFDNKEISEFISGFKVLNLPSPIYAMITKHSIKWKLKKLINHLVEEREEFKKRSKKI